LDGIPVADITENMYIPAAGLESGVHTWSIKAQNYFQYSESEERTVHISLQPGKPTLLKPTTTQTTPTVILEWSEAVHASTYNVELATDSDFSNVIDSTANLTTTQWTVTLPSDGTYYWRVTAYDNTDLSTTSDVFELELNTESVGGSIIPPILRAPTITQTTDPPTFTWDPCSVAVSHTIEIATDSTDFSNTLVLSDSTLTGSDSAFTPSAALGEGTFYWRVTGIDATSTMYESVIWRVEVKSTPSTPASAPELLEPSVSMCIDTPMFSWTSVSDVDHYHLAIATDAAFTAPVAYEADTSGTTHTPTSALPDDTYYWRVTAHFSSGGSEQSNPYLLIVVKLPQVNLVGRLTGDSEPFPQFEWDSVLQGSYYELEIAMTSLFDSGDIVYAKSLLTNTTHTCDTALANDTYYWRVRRVSYYCEDSVWSTEDSFVIDVQEKPIIVVGSVTNTNADFVVKKFNPNGTEDMSWDITADSGGTDGAYDVAIDSNNNVYVVGYKLEIGYDWWIKKYDSSGAEQTAGDGWDKSYDSTGSNDRAFAVAVSDSGDVYVAGYEYNGMTPSNDWHLKKFAPDGTEDDTNWDLTFNSGSGQSDWARDIALNNATSTVYIAGNASGAPDWWLKSLGFDGSAGWNQQTNFGGNDYASSAIVDEVSGNIVFAGLKYNSNTLGYVRCLNPSGGFVWHDDVTNGTETVELHATAIDTSTSDVYVVGTSRNQVSPTSSYDMLIKKYQIDGTEITTGWNKGLDNGNTSDKAQGVAVDAFGSVYVVGNTGSDWWIQKFKQDGTFEWDTTVGNGSAYGVAVFP
jgi:hypothetical protein